MYFCKKKSTAMLSKNTIDKVINIVENSILVIIVLFLIISAILLIIDEVYSIFTFSTTQPSVKIIIEIISKTLLLLMIIEILITVKISINEHILSCQPFIIIGLIAAVRRILIISVEIAYLHEMFYYYIIEMGVLIALILIFVISLTMLRKNSIK